jgi:hypothetical protein
MPECDDLNAVMSPNCLLLLLLVSSVGGIRLETRRYRINSSFKTKSCLKLSSSSDDLDALRLDENKLSEEEQERLRYIKTLTEEADQFARDAGFIVDDDEDDDEDRGIYPSVKDTEWSGQSDLDMVTLSNSNWGDISSRKGLVTADILALLTFAAVGRNNHGEGLDVIALLGTAAPFIGSWLLVSPLLGSYTRDATKSKGGITAAIVPSWVVSVGLALAIRGFIKGAVPPPPFIVVSLVSTLGLLSVYRYGYISLVGETSDEDQRSAGALEVFKMVGSLIKRW